VPFQRQSTGLIFFNRQQYVIEINSDLQKETGDTLWGYQDDDIFPIKV